MVAFPILLEVTFERCGVCCAPNSGCGGVPASATAAGDTARPDAGHEAAAEALGHEAIDDGVEAAVEVGAEAEGRLDVLGAACPRVS